MLKVVLLGLVIRKGFLVLNSSSHPEVAGAAYRSKLEDGASLVRSSSRPGVAGAAYLPAFAGGGSCLALPAEDLRTWDVVDGVILDDISKRSSKLSEMVRALRTSGDVSSR